MTILIGAIALALGAIIGYLLAKSRTAGVAAELALAKGSVASLEKQITTMQSAQTETTRLATELEAMKKSVEVLSSQARDAAISRSTAEEGLRKDLTNMAQANKALLDETTKIAGALTSSQK
ncbi:MAG: hypothetical protein F2870_04955, partial [Actinobacteria bacterium]|nr:hypothetical protein [Actinomycetota bacterium]